MIHAERCDPPLIVSNALLNTILLVVAFLMQSLIAAYFTFTYCLELSRPPNPNSFFADMVEIKATAIIVLELVVLLFLVAVPVASALMGIRRMGNQSGEFMVLYIVLTLVSMVELVIMAAISAGAAVYFFSVIQFPINEPIGPADILLQERFLRVILFSGNAVLYIVQPLFRFFTTTVSIFVHMTVKLNKAIMKRKESKHRKKTGAQDPNYEGHRHRHHRKRGNAVVSMESGSRPAVVPLQPPDTRHDSIQSVLQPTLRIDTSKYMLRLEDFRLLERIGSGGFGSVFRAEYEDSIVALKILNFDPEKETPEEVTAFIKEFQNEAELLCQLRHPNILFFLGVCMGPKYAIATEFLDTGSLADVLHKPDLRREKHIQLTWQLKLKIMIDVSRGVKYLHSMNLIHRDLKPHNILLDKNCVAKVADFGLAKSTNKHLRGISSYVSSFDASQQMTTFVGSPLWMSPEVILSYNYDHKADVFSFGITMWEVLFEQCPYDNVPLHAMQIAQKVATEGMRPPLLPVPDPDDTHIKTRDLYVRLMEYCWMHDPRNRPNMEDIVKELKLILEKADQEAAASQSTNSSNSAQSTEISPNVSSPNLAPDSLNSESNDSSGPPPPEPAQNQPAPVQHQPAPGQRQSIPVQSQPAPVQHQPAPVQHQPAPIQNQLAPGQRQSIPVQNQPAPVQQNANFSPNPTFMSNYPPNPNYPQNPNYPPNPNHPQFMPNHPNFGPNHPNFRPNYPPSPNQMTFMPNNQMFVQNPHAPGPNHPNFRPNV